MSAWYGFAMLEAMIRRFWPKHFILVLAVVVVGAITWFAWSEGFRLLPGSGEKYGYAIGGDGRYAKFSVKDLSILEYGSIFDDTDGSRKIRDCVVQLVRMDGKRGIIYAARYCYDLDNRLTTVIAYSVVKHQPVGRLELITEDSEDQLDPAVIVATDYRRLVVNYDTVGGDVGVPDREIRHSVVEHYSLPNLERIDVFERDVAFDAPSNDRDLYLQFGAQPISDGMVLNRNEVRTLRGEFVKRISKEDLEPCIKDYKELYGTRWDGKPYNITDWYHSAGGRMLFIVNEKHKGIPAQAVGPTGSATVVYDVTSGQCFVPVFEPNRLISGIAMLIEGGDYVIVENRIFEVASGKEIGGLTEFKGERFVRLSPKVEYAYYVDEIMDTFNYLSIVRKQLREAAAEPTGVRLEQRLLWPVHIAFAER